MIGLIREPSEKSDFGISGKQDLAGKGFYRLFNAFSSGALFWTVTFYAIPQNLKVICHLYF